MKVIWVMAKYLIRTTSTDADYDFDSHTETDEKYAVEEKIEVKYLYMLSQSL